MKVYIIGSLKNKDIPYLANQVRELGFEVFDDWFAPGPEADDYWKQYEQQRGRSYPQALEGWAARHIFEFDKHHIDESDIGIMVMPAGKSAHLELGYMAGQGKCTYILLESDPDRWDVMYQFANKVCFTTEQLLDELRIL